MKNRRITLIAILFMLSISSYLRIIGNENIRTIQFLSIFAIGALSALLVREIALILKSRNE